MNTFMEKLKLKVSEIGSYKKESTSTLSSEGASIDNQRRVARWPFDPVDLKNREDILKYVENQDLPLKRQEQLENGICLTFACKGIAFNVARNEIFRMWLQDLKPGFKIPSPKMLARRIFNKQIIKKDFGNSESTCQQLLEQLFSYKENEPPYNDPFKPEKWTNNNIELNSANIIEEEPNYDYNVDSLVNE
ncbi:18522_t:CDS:2, partial [Racocetra fulgida]